MEEVICNIEVQKTHNLNIKKSLQTNQKQVNYPLEKWAKDLNKHFKWYSGVFISHQREMN